MTINTEPLSWRIAKFDALMRKLERTLRDQTDLMDGLTPEGLSLWQEYGYELDCCCAIGAMPDFTATTLPLVSYIPAPTPDDAVRQAVRRWRIETAARGIYSDFHRN